MNTNISNIIITAKYAKVADRSIYSTVYFFLKHSVHEILGATLCVGRGSVRAHVICHVDGMGLPLEPKYRIFPHVWQYKCGFSIANGIICVWIILLGIYFSNPCIANTHSISSSMFILIVINKKKPK